MLLKITKKTFNDYHLALAFTVLFTAYNGQSHIQVRYDKKINISLKFEVISYYSS